MCACVHTGFVNTWSEDYMNVFPVQIPYLSPSLMTATDHVGQTSTVNSLGLTVDVSPPVIMGPHLGVAYSATAISQLQPQWELIHDPESGVFNVFWALGSNTGLGDLVNWTQVVVTETSAALPSTMNISDGQTIVLTLMVNK